MIALSFVACLSWAAQCEEFRLPTDASLFWCNIGAQPQLAQWARHRPGWRVVRYWCSADERA